MPTSLTPHPGANVRVLPPELLFELSRLGQARLVRKGTVVVREGDAANGMYLIHEGQLRVFMAGEGEREVELNQMGPGEYFGELMLSGELRSASVQALTPARLTQVSGEQFQQALGSRPDLAFHVIQALIERVRALSKRVQGLASLDVYGRLVRLFDELAETLPNGQRGVPGPMSQQKMATRVGASRSMINRLMHDLVAGGYVEVGREHIILLKPLPKRW